MHFRQSLGVEYGRLLRGLLRSARFFSKRRRADLRRHRHGGHVQHAVLRGRVRASDGHGRLAHDGFTEVGGRDHMKGLAREVNEQDVPTLA